MNQPTEEKPLRFYFPLGMSINSGLFYLFLLHYEDSIHLLPDEKIKLEIFSYEIKHTLAFACFYYFVLLPHEKIIGKKCRHPMNQVAPALHNKYYTRARMCHAKNSWLLIFVVFLVAD